MKACAVERGFTPKQIELMFDIFREWNIAKGTWSDDWGQVWINWVDREVDLVQERYEREERQAYWARRRAA
jgi:hypothetical protein